MNQELSNKYEDLISYLQSLGSVAVAYSAGVDSTFLLYAANQALGDNVIAVTAKLSSMPSRELDEATDYANMLGLRHYVLEIDQLEIEGFKHNPTDRCYICKRHIFEKIINQASEQAIEYVAEGSNLDDDGDYRPGMRAIEELGVRSPLRQVGLTKAEIRLLSKEFNLPTWDKPSLACLATRIPYGDEITEEKLIMVDEAEECLLDLGFKQVRVRVHGDLARIEVGQDEMIRLVEEDMRQQINSSFKKIGFSYVSMDIIGYRTGSMNENIIN